MYGGNKKPSDKDLKRFLLLLTIVEAILAIANELKDLFNG